MILEDIKVNGAVFQSAFEATSARGQQRPSACTGLMMVKDAGFVVGGDEGMGEDGGG